MLVKHAIISFASAAMSILAPGCAGCMDCACVRGDTGFQGDAGVDAATTVVDGGRDSGADSHAGPDDPGWAHFSAVPDECRVEIAEHPDRLVIEVGWTACGEGCRRWTGTRDISIRTPYRDGDRWVATVRWLTADMAVVLAFVDIDLGIPIAALRDHRFSDGTSLCVVAGGGVAGGDSALVMQFFEYDATGENLLRSWDRFLRAPNEDVRGQARLIAEVVPGGLSVQEFLIGPDIMAAQLEGLLAIAIEEGRITDVSRALPESVQRLALIGRDILWENWATNVRLAAWAGADAFVLREVAGGDIRGFASDRGTEGDGSAIAWMEATGLDDATGRYAQVELWTGTYRDGALLDARRVRAMNHQVGGLLGDGLYVRAELDPMGASVYAFYRLSDGARAAWVPPDGSAPDQVIAVTTDEALLLSWSTYFRVDPRTLVFETP